MYKASDARLLASYLNTAEVRRVVAELVLGLVNKYRHLPHAQP